MLNYANLNGMEFEALCKDVMERMLGVSLRRFAEGRDGGVDLTDDVSEKNIVVQVKHYQKSSIDALIRSLKNEKPKVDILQPQHYYICCSMELSHPRINELYQYFRTYMASDRHIVTLFEIDEFLNQESNKDILKRHFKLWLDSTGILEDIFNNRLFVDCEVLLDDITEQQKLFVQTDAFDCALSALENRQILCIVGNPGVGKSITSKMLVMHYAAEGYQVRYTSDTTNLQELKASLSHDSDKKEIILLDDCFGQRYFDLKSSQSSALVTLIKYVKRHPNKKLILNSRVTIFRDARQSQLTIAQSLDHGDFKVFILDISNLSGLEKAKILYNHLSFYDLPDEYMADILKDQRYRKIVFHPNYCPRIIEYACSPHRYLHFPADGFYNSILRHLDNPSSMWADEYDNRLLQTDRILLQTIYSLTATTVSATLVQQCFNRRIASIPSVDQTTDSYNQSLNRLNQGFVRILDKYNRRELAMYNPSVNDFLDKRLQLGTAERDALIRSICNEQQLRLIPEKERIPYSIDLLQSGKIDTFIFTEPHQRIQFIGYRILCSKLCLGQYQNELFTYLISPEHPFCPMPIFLLPHEIWEFYHLREFLCQSDNLYKILIKLTLIDAIALINEIDSHFCVDGNEAYHQQVTKFFRRAWLHSEYVFSVEASDYDHIVNIEQAFSNPACLASDGESVDTDAVATIIEEQITEAAFLDFQSLLRSLPQPFSHYADQLTTDYVFVDGVDSMINDYIYDNLFTNNISEGEEDESDEQYSPIDAIFER